MLYVVLSPRPASPPMKHGQPQLPGVSPSDTGWAMNCKSSLTQSPRILRMVKLVKGRSGATPALLSFCQRARDVRMWCLWWNHAGVWWGEGGPRIRGHWTDQITNDPTSKLPLPNLIFPSFTIYWGIFSLKMAIEWEEASLTSCFLAVTEG